MSDAACFHGQVCWQFFRIGGTNEHREWHCHGCGATGSGEIPKVTMASEQGPKCEV